MAAADFAPPGLRAASVSVTRGGRRVLSEVSFAAPGGQVTAIVGPAGSGKGALLRCFNRMHDLDGAAEMSGAVFRGNEELVRLPEHLAGLRRRIVLVSGRAGLFPRSISFNVAFGLRINRYRGDIDRQVQTALETAGLWPEVGDRLDQSAMALGAGQMQRLCLARALAVEPEALLLDHPTSGLDRNESGKIEDIIVSLRGRHTILLATENLGQASRISDYTAFVQDGELVEFGETERVFTNPEHPLTEAFITGRTG